MVVRTSLLFFVSSLAFFLPGCGSSTAVLGTIANDQITLEEFEEMYAKTNGGWESGVKSSVEDRERFLDLLVKYKLKLREANTRGLIQDTAVQNEVNSYRFSVASSYMIEKELIEPNLRLIYDRRKEEIRASHILVRVGPDASPADTLAAYSKILRILTLVSRTGFDSVARAYSEDPSAASNNGDVGWFSQGRMVREFEDAVYRLQPGTLTTTPVRTRFGYHLIKVTGRQPNRGSVQVSHILKRFSPNMTDTTAVKDSVYLLYNRLLRKELTFDQAVALYSDDPASKGQGGAIGSYERSGLPPDIATVFFSTPVDSISPPHRASYGYHIFKITGTRPLPSFPEMERSLRQEYQQTRYNQDYADYVQALRKTYRATMNPAPLSTFMQAFDTTKTPSDSAWISTAARNMRPVELARLGQRSVTVGDMLVWLAETQEFKALSLVPGTIQRAVNRFVDAEVLNEHARGAEQRHPALGKLMKEYESGVLIYRIEQDEVWGKIHMTDSLLRAHYDTTKQRYRWGERVNIGEIFVRSDSAAQAAYWKIMYGEDFGEVAEEYTVRPGFKEKEGVWGFQPVELNGLTQRAKTMAIDSISAPFAYEGGWSIVTVLGKDVPRTKIFEEASPEVTSAYQEIAAKRREQEWIEELMQKYQVKVNRALVGDAFKKKRDIAP